MWCLWVKWTAGRDVIANDSSQVHWGRVCEWFSYLFPQQAKPLQESRIRHLWERLVFISRRHLPRCTICWEKMARIQRMEKCFQKLSLKRSLIVVSTFYSLTVHLSGFYLSLYTLYLISLTKPITAMFLQPLQLDSASYWPFTRLLYNTRNHWISNPLLELQ